MRCDQTIRLLSLLLILAGLGFSTAMADTDQHSMIAPTTWSDQVEQDLVNLVAKNEQAHQVYARVVRRLRRSGFPAVYVHGVFSHPEVMLDDNVVQRLTKPAESMDYSDYRRIFVNDKRIRHGVTFYRTYGDLLHQIADQYGVDPYLMLSFVGVETQYGSFTSKYSVFNSLHTIIHHIPRRAKWAEDEMVAWFIVCRVDNMDPLLVRGSYAGAFGYGQFMPTSFKKYAVDGDGDGQREPFDWADVLASIANYLLKRGQYEVGSTDFSPNSRNWRAVYKYNPSRNYVKAVLELRSELIKAIEKS